MEDVIMTLENNGTGNNQSIAISLAKGRPFLSWVGKKPINAVSVLPAQHIETFGDTSNESWADWPEFYPQSGMLFHGDNVHILAHLLANGFRNKIDLVYIDPPFDSGANYVRSVKLRGVSGTVKIDGELYSLGEQIQYEDIWSNDNYFQFMYERFLLIRELLKDEGHIIVQADDKRGHYLKIILDEVMGPENYINDVVWRKGREGGGGSLINPPLPTEYQNIYIYSKFRKHRMWNPPKGPYKSSTLSSLEVDKDGWYYTRGRMGRIPRPWEVEAGVSKKTYVWNDASVSKEEVIKKLTAPDAEFVLIGDVWDSDIIKNSTITGYPTEKPESLLEIIIKASTNPNSVVLDCFVGSGTTIATAQKLGRRWIGCDINKGAIQTTAKRIQNVIIKQKEEMSQQKITDDLLTHSKVTPQLGYTLWRINDYDLEIQHNEAIKLVCEYVGVERTRTDLYFDGIRGKSIVKIIPFEHPLTLFDLKELEKELESRPDEDRSITIICLGIEIKANEWINDWNRLRKGTQAINHIELIELGTDPKYGSFIKHDSAKADIDIEFDNDIIKIKINDFISPTIIKRINQQSESIKPIIQKWQQMVDCVMIDTDYNGEVFNIVVSDVPQKNNELVKDYYELPASNIDRTVAVKIIDMLGEEIIVSKSLSQNNVG